MLTFAMSRERWESIRRRDIEVTGLAAIAAQLRF